MDVAQKLNLVVVKHFIGDQLAKIEAQHIPVLKQHVRELADRIDVKSHDRRGYKLSGCRQLVFDIIRHLILGKHIAVESEDRELRDRLGHGIGNQHFRFAEIVVGGQSL